MPPYGKDMAADLEKECQRRPTQPIHDVDAENIDRRDSMGRLYNKGSLSNSSGDYDYSTIRGNYDSTACKACKIVICALVVLIAFLSLCQLYFTIVILHNQHPLNSSSVVQSESKGTQRIIECSDDSLSCYTDEYARSLLHAAHITIVSSHNCTDRHDPHCTSFEQIHMKVIDAPNGVLGLKRNISCPHLVITGGTETGQFSSWNGWLLNMRHWGVDSGECLTHYVKTNYVPLPNGKLDGGNETAFYCGPGDVIFMEIPPRISHNQRWNVNYGSGCGQAALTVNMKLAFGPDWINHQLT